MEKQKFPWDISFQEEILRFLVNNSDGYKALKFLDHRYFSLLEHSVIVFGIEKFYRNSGKIPSLPFLRNILQTVFRDKEFVDSLTAEDREHILGLVNTLYNKPARDGEELLEEIVRYSSFVDLKETLDNFNLENYSEYLPFLDRITRAIHKVDQLTDKGGIFLIEGIKDRQLDRQVEELVIPTPFYQLNRLTAAGGFSPASVIVVVDKPKKLKTTFLVNVSRRYLARKKRIFYADLENGELEITTRVEQSIGRVSKKEIIKGVKDKEIQKVLRRYKRLGGELYVKRFPGYSTVREFEAEFDRLYREKGFKPDVLIVDYIGLMGALSGKTDDFGRISDAYIDVANFALKHKLDIVYTAHHILRGSSKRERTRYIGDDIAKSIDILRHAQAIFGLNRSIEEEENGLVRLELIDGRETKPTGRAYFSVDANTQRLDELTTREVEELTEQGILYNPDYKTPESSEKPRKTSGDI